MSKTSMTEASPTEILITESFTFSSAHYYYRPEWSEDENRERFGGCANSHGHGHDYRLEIEIKTSLETAEEDTQHLHEVTHGILRDFDHHHLNHNLPEFADGRKIPTTENIALLFQKKIRDTSPGLIFSRIRLFERPDLWTELTMD